MGVIVDKQEEVHLENVRTKCKLSMTPDLML